MRKESKESSRLPRIPQLALRLVRAPETPAASRGRARRCHEPHRIRRVWSGLALVQQGFDRLSGLRLKVRPLTPKHPPHVAGIAYRRNVNSSATKNFIAAAKRSATSA